VLSDLYCHLLLYKIDKKSGHKRQLFCTNARNVVHFSVLLLERSEQRIFNTGAKALT
jgi:hypothetical protein